MNFTVIRIKNFNILVIVYKYSVLKSKHIIKEDVRFNLIYYY